MHYIYIHYTRYIFKTPKANLINLFEKINGKTKAMNKIQSKPSTPSWAVRIWCPRQIHLEFWLYATNAHWFRVIAFQHYHLLDGAQFAGVAGVCGVVQQFWRCFLESQGKAWRNLRWNAGEETNSLKLFLLTVVRSQMIDMAKVFFSNIWYTWPHRFAYFRWVFKRHMFGGKTSCTSSRNWLICHTWILWVTHGII